ncbi:MAG: CoA transferase, partial [Clostridia bacterium]|nr:CoA transferase [Clostridia bacterium]
VVSQSRQSFAEYYATNGNVRRPGNSYRGVEPTAPWNIYPCQGNDITGNYVAICCRPEPEYQDFEKLCKAMGREDLLEDLRYKTPALRYENRHALDFEIQKWTYTMQKRNVMNKLAVELQIPCGAVLGPADMLRKRSRDAESGILRWMDTEKYEFVQDARGNVLDGVYVPTLPLNFESGDIRPINPGPYGSSNKDVYCGFLGMSEEEYQSLVDNKII